MILCSGCFDGLHAGHVAYLQAAAQFRQSRDAGSSDVMEDVVVAIAPDSYIRHIKGRDPYWSVTDRVKTVSAVRGVTQAYPIEELTPATFIRTRKPRVFVKGVDWAGKLPGDIIAACRDVGCVIVYVETERTHTSEACAT